MKKYKRIFLIVLDSLGIGAMPHRYVRAYLDNTERT